ncbi:MAG: ABC transporter substrate-binding protein [Candidatus Alcyoniella australis]|nr:ABC transporter substrate-binding protein [Candidatus Alcyoniella australis]
MRCTGGLCLALALLVLCPHSALADEASELFSNAEAAYSAGDFEQALELYRKLVVHHGEARFIDRCLYRVGAIYIRLEDPPKARIYFDKLVREQPQSEFAREALYYRGYCSYEVGEQLKASEDFRAYLDQGPDALRLGQAQLYLGRSLGALGQAGSSLAGFAAAWRILPQSDQRDTSVIEARRVATGLGDDRILLSLLDSLERGPVRDVVAIELARRQIAAGRRDKAQGTLDRADLKQGPASIRLEAQRLRQATLPQRGGTRDVFIGCVLPLSGRLSVYGEQALKGLLLGIGAYDEPQLEDTLIHLLVRDSQGDPNLAAQCVRELAQSDVVAIVGPLLSSEAVTSATEAQRLGIPLITLTRKEHIAGIGDWIFRAFTTDSAQVEELVRYAAEIRKVKRVAVLYPLDRYGETMAADFQREARARGLELVISMGYEPTSVDWHRELRDLKRAGRVDALFIPDFSRTVSVIVPQLMLLTQQPLLLGPSGWNDQHLAAALGEQLFNAVIVDGFFEGATDQATQVFLRDYQRYISGRPDLISASAYDVGRILDRQLSRNPGADRGMLRELLWEVRDFPGVCGPTSFDATGEIRRPLKLLGFGPSGIQSLD